jgi:uncharacterized repeat protein (TIGR01451 family)
MTKLTGNPLLANALALILLPPACLASPLLELTHTVSNATPMRNEPVEFTIAIVNRGDEIALDVKIVDLLPPELVIPPGMAVFTARGDYDPASGTWSLGDLDAGAGSSMSLPAMLAVDEPPPCIVNIATATFADAADDDEVTARVAIRRTGAEHCVDLDPDFAISVGDVIFPECDHRGRYNGHVDVSNLGPDMARDVLVTITQDPVFGPNLRFDDSDCENSPAAHCEISAVPAGETVSIDVTSDLFQSHTQFEQTIAVQVSTTDIDYDPSNDNPGDTGTAGGFSSCTDFGLDFDDAFVAGPGCFIATAAFGSALHPHVEALRAFRDRVLLQHRAGRAFVEFYYRHSPPIAELIATRPWVRAIVRWMLAPLVYGVAYPGIALSILVMLIAQGTRGYGRRRRRLQARICTEGGPLTG